MYNICVTELSGSLQEILDAFKTNYLNGGIAACRTMVADLEAEASMAKATSGAVNGIDSETIQLQDVIPTSVVLSRLEMTRSVSKDTMTAISRYSFALYLLDVFEKAQATS
jgi:hypothetical protein